MNHASLCNQMRQYLNRIKRSVSPDASAQIEIIMQQLNNMAGACDTFSSADLTSAYSNLRRDVRNASRTLENIRSRVDTTRYSSAEKKSMKTLAAMEEKLSEFQTVINEYTLADGQITRYSTNYGVNKKDQTKAMRQLTEKGMNPGYGDCESIKFPADTKEKEQQTHANFIWLGMQKAKSNALAGTEAANHAAIYDKTFTRLKNELYAAPPQSRAAFALSMCQYERYLLLQASKSLKTISNGRSNLTPEQQAKAISDPAITNAAAFRSFRLYMENDPLMKRYISDARKDTLIKEFPAASRVVSKISSPSLDDPITARAMNERRSALLNEMHTGVFSSESKMGQLFDLYDKIVSSEGKNPSPAYDAIKTSLKKVIDKKVPVNENDPEFQKAMLDCEKAARDFVTTNPQNPRSSADKKRVALANNLLDISRSYTEAYVKSQENANEKKAKELKKAIRTNPKKQIQKYLELSKLQKVIAPVHTVPKIAKAVNTVSNYRKSGFGHAVGWVSNIVSSNTYGLVFGAVSEAVTHQSDKGTSKSIDTKHVPGTRYEQYHDEKDENGLFYDTRKIPLLWAREIPEEPVNDIEFSIDVEQAREGTDLGSDVGTGFKEGDAVGEDGERFGHAFISLKYTQKDPVTGQPKRYKTSFGFYPQDIFKTTSQMINQGQYGAKQIGILVDDFTHPVSTSKSFKITPDQFNKIVSFAQTYENGGYNMLTRNCVSFTKACVDEIDLKEAKELYQETDLNSGTVKHAAAPGASTVFGVGYAAKSISKNELYKLQDVNAYSYNRYGQKLVSKEDLKLQDMESYNVRAKGYSPGLLGEMMREKDDIPLHTNKWKGTKSLQNEAKNSTFFTGNKIYTRALENNQPAEKLNGILDSLTENYSKKFNLICLQKQFELLKQKIKNLPEFRNKNKANDNALKKMQEFSNNLLDSMNMLLDDIDINNESSYHRNYDYKPVNYTAKKKAYHNLVKLSNAYVEGMNDIFRNTFRSDPRLNLEFGKVISFAQRVSDIATEEYPRFVKKDHIGFDNLNMLKGEFDTSREALRSMYDIKFKNRDYFFSNTLPNGTKKQVPLGMSLTPLETYAAIKVYGSLENAIKMNYQSTNENVYEYTDMNKRYKAASLSERLNLTKYLGKNMENKLGKYYEPTLEDYQMIFNKLPSNEWALESNDGRNRIDDYTDPYHSSNALKGLIFEKYFGGYTEEAKKFAKSLRSPKTIEMLSLKQSDEIKSGSIPDEVIENERSCTSYIDNLKYKNERKMTNFILDKIEKSGRTKQAFEKMKNETAKFLFNQEFNRPYDPKEPGANEALEAFKDNAEARVVRDIIGTFLEPQCDYQVACEFKGPKATKKDKLMFGRTGCQIAPNSSERLKRFEERYQMYKTSRELAKNAELQNNQAQNNANRNLPGI